MTGRLNTDFYAAYADDAAALQMIRKTYEQQGYLCDPHTAVALCAVHSYRRTEKNCAPCVVLSTASPYKFSDRVLGALGLPIPEKDFDTLRSLHNYTGVGIPVQLSSLEKMPVRFTGVITPDEVEEAARRL